MKIVQKRWLKNKDMVCSSQNIINCDKIYLQQDRRIKTAKPDKFNDQDEDDSLYWPLIDSFQRDVTLSGVILRLEFRKLRIFCIYISIYSVILRAFFTYT